MPGLAGLSYHLQDKLKAYAITPSLAFNELTIEVPVHQLLLVMRLLRDDPLLHFEMLMDLAGVDYSHYGVSEWTTVESTRTGFSRGTLDNISSEHTEKMAHKPRFAVVYHLLSLLHNWRLRVRTFAIGEHPLVPSVIGLWNSANWYEREAFDLFGILFEGHADLRRILTDYGFIGHPFRKDFPLIGQVEMRYCATEKRVVYEPVSITPRTLVPKTIRDDHRYLQDKIE